MAIKILENNAVDVTNIDGAAFNNFSAGNRDGIVGGYLNECALSATGNSLILSTGCLLLRGVRVNISEVESVTLSSTPSADTRYQLVAQISRDSNKVFTWSLFAQVPITLITDDIINNSGTYQVEVGRFTHTTLGTITDIIRTADILYGGASITADINVGNVTTDILAPGLDAEIDIDKRVDDKKTYLDFKFSLPATAGTAVIVNDVEQESISFTSDPQTQINDKVSKDGAKVLSDNNYSTAEKSKLAGIEAGAQVNDDDISGSLQSLNITTSSGVRRVRNRNVSGTISGSATIYLYGCEGSITISGNTAKIYIYNSEINKMIVSGETSSNWLNIYRDNERFSFKRQLLEFDYTGATEVTDPSYKRFDTKAKMEAFFGGTWEAHGAGCVTLGQNVTYPAGTTGGEANVKLTTEQMPSHAHDLDVSGSMTSTRDYLNLSYGQNWRTFPASGGIMGYAGGGQSHNNMQPYVSVYRWRRIA